MSDAKAIRIEVEYDDGLLERATGDDATEIWRQVNGAFALRHIHGMPYNGPKLKPVAAPQTVMTTTEHSDLLGPLRELVEAVAKDAVKLAIMRHWHDFEEDSEMSEEEVAQDSVNALMGYDSCEEGPMQSVKTLQAGMERVRGAEILREHNYFYSEPFGERKTGFYHCLCGWEGPDRNSYWKHLPTAAQDAAVCPYCRHNEGSMHAEDCIVGRALANGPAKQDEGGE